MGRQSGQFLSKRKKSHSQFLIVGDSADNGQSQPLRPIGLLDFFVQVGAYILQFIEGEADSFDGLEEKPLPGSKLHFNDLISKYPTIVE